MLFLGVRRGHNKSEIVFTLTNVSSNVLKLGPVGNELLLGWNVDAHVAREPDWWRGHSDMNLSRS